MAGNPAPQSSPAPAVTTLDPPASGGQVGQTGPPPIWKGTISFGLVTVPVRLYSATETKEELSFHLLHKKDKARVEYKRVCTAEGVEVPWSQIVKGYEYEKGQYVVMTDEDFAKARTPATQSFDIRVFVDADEVEDVYFGSREHRGVAAERLDPCRFLRKPLPADAACDERPLKRTASGRKP